MSDTYILSGLQDHQVQCVFPEISMGQIIFDSLKNRNEDSIGVINAFANESIKFSEILTDSVKMANALRNMGVGKADVVAIISENTIQMSVPMAACFYIGAALNPLNPSYTNRELKQAMDLSRPKIIFTSETSLKTVLSLKSELDYLEIIIVMGQGLDVNTIDYEELLKNNEANINDFKIEEIIPKEQVAWIMCSSGTTGLPKGVMLSHNNLRLALTFLGDPKFVGMNENVSTVCLLPFYHVFGSMLLIGGLVFGMKLVLITKFKPDTFLQCIQDYQITKLFLVPSLALFLAKSPIVDNYDVSHINDVICAAAPLGYEIQTILEERLNVLVRQGYGMTESSGFITVTPMGVSNKAGSSGKLTYQVLAKVTDLDSKVMLGPNKVGEICCKSDLNMFGYVRNEEATREMYDEEGFLHTGDIGYYDQDGFFYIVDRLKELIKYKGFQVPPAELEDILTCHAAVKDAAVIGKPDERAGEVPLAFIVKQPDAEVTEQQLIDYVAQHVSVQKHLHGGVRFVDEIPKNATGKILRKKLRELL